MKHVFTFLLLFLCLWTLSAQTGYRIEVNIDNYQEPNLYLGYHYGDKTMVQDTAEAAAPGTFVFSGDEPLAGGLYLIIMAPDNNYFQILVDEDEQNYSISTVAENPSGNIQFTGAPDNELFYKYLGFLGDKRPLAQNIQQQMAASQDDAEKAKLQAQLEQINRDVTQYQKDLVAQYPESLTALIIQANMPMEDVPEFTGTEEEQQEKRWYYTREHFLTTWTFPIRAYSVRPSCSSRWRPTWKNCIFRYRILSSRLSTMC
jgi:hypothetical protein